MLSKRHVFYLSGFDPRGPSFYHDLYKTESEYQVHAQEISIAVGKRTTPSKRLSRWDITASANGHAISTRYDFLRWDDIVRQHWTRNEGLLLLKTLATFWLFLRTGLLARAWKAAWKPTALFIYPTLFLLLTLLLAVAASWAAHRHLTPADNPYWLREAVTLAVFLTTLALGRLLSARTSAYWLLRLCNFCGSYGQGRLACIDERMAEFTEIIASEISKGEADEYLVVGHSVGAILAIPVLAKMIDSHKELAGRNIALLTLGHCIPLVSFLPHARHFRESLNTVANASHICWIDFSSPADPACFALVDPVGASGLSIAAPSIARPKLLNARFYKAMTESRYRKLRKDGKRMHFQYLMAGDVPVEYDYFALTAGELSLQERFRNTPGLTPTYPR
jgi:hypothetical protein